MRRTLSYWLAATALALAVAPIPAPAEPPAGVHVYDVTPSIVAFTSHGRAWTMVFAFDVREPLPAGSGTFVHFTRDGEEITQYGTGIEASPDKWPVGQIIKGRTQYARFPPVMADGEYPILVGIWTPSNGRRLYLKGIDDGQQRYQAGILVVKNHGRSLNLKGAPPMNQDAEAKIAIQNRPD